MARTFEPTRLSTPTAALLLIGAVTAVRVAALVLSDLNLDGDEAQYWSWAQQPAFGYYSKPPLIAWLIASTTAVCGDGEACVRIASPLLHALTSGVLFFLGRRLFGEAVGFWSALTYLTLPGVWVSAGLITTDVPLLFFWAVGLLAFTRALEGSRGAALLLGIAVGLGMLSKYAMLYFVGSAVLYCLTTPSARGFLSSRGAALAAGMAAIIIAPNVAWNLGNGLATLGHTVDNAGWTGPLLHPLRALEFVGAQFGVFGPIPMFVLGWVVWQSRRQQLSPQLRMLLFFTVPVLALITGQAFISRAYANWAAVAYPAATVAVVAWLLNREKLLTVKLSIGGHVAMAGLLYALVFGALPAARLGPGDPLAKVRGWDAMAREVAGYLDEHPGVPLLVDERMVMAELAYYLRDRSPVIHMWHVQGRPPNHYALTAPLPRAHTGPVLYVTRMSSTDAVASRFADIVLLGKQEIRAGTVSPRTLSIYRLDEAPTEETAHALPDRR